MRLPIPAVQTSLKAPIVVLPEVQQGALLVPLPVAAIPRVDSEGNSLEQGSGEMRNIESSTPLPYPQPLPHPAQQIEGNQAQARPYNFITNRRATNKNKRTASSQEMTTPSPPQKRTKTTPNESTKSSSSSDSSRRSHAQDGNETTPTKKNIIVLRLPALKTRLRGFDETSNQKGDSSISGLEGDVHESPNRRTRTKRTKTTSDKSSRSGSNSSQGSRSTRGSEPAKKKKIIILRLPALKSARQVLNESSVQDANSQTSGSEGELDASSRGDSNEPSGEVVGNNGDVASDTTDGINDGTEERNDVPATTIRGNKQRGRISPQVSGMERRRQRVLEFKAKEEERKKQQGKKK